MTDVEFSKWPLPWGPTLEDTPLGVQDRELQRLEWRGEVWGDGCQGLAVCYGALGPAECRRTMWKRWGIFLEALVKESKQNKKKNQQQKWKVQWFCHFHSQFPIWHSKILVCSKMDVTGIIWFSVLVNLSEKEVPCFKSRKQSVWDRARCRSRWLVHLDLGFLSCSATGTGEVLKAPGKLCRQAFKFTHFMTSSYRGERKKKKLAFWLQPGTSWHINLKKPNGKIDRTRSQVDKLTNKVSDLTVSQAADLLKLRFLLNT